MVVALVWIVIAGCLTAAYLATVSGRNRRALATSQMAVTSSDEYRRLAEMAVTAQEHSDLKLQELMIQVAQLQEQISWVQKILKEVE